MALKGDCSKTGSSLTRFERGSSSKLTSNATDLSFIVPISVLLAIRGSETAASSFRSGLVVRTLDSTRDGGRFFDAFSNPTLNATPSLAEILENSCSVSVSAAFSLDDSANRPASTLPCVSSSAD